MRFATLTLALLTLAAAGLHAAPPATTTAPADVGDALANCRRDALATVEAFGRRDVDAMMKSMHPDALLASPEAVRETLAATFADWERRGIRSTNRLADGPAEVFAGAGDRRFAIVWQAMDMRFVTGARVEATGYLLGVSDDRGGTWRFVGGEGFKNRAVTTQFPDYPLEAHPLPVNAPPKATPATRPAP